MWGPRSIAKLVNITPITMVYGTQITIVTGAYKPTIQNYPTSSKINHLLALDIQETSNFPYEAQLVPRHVVVFVCICI